MWFPTTSELLSEKVATRLVNSSDFAVSGFSQSDLTDDKIESALLKTEVFAAIRKVDPQTYNVILQRFAAGIRQGKTQADIRSEVYPLTANLLYRLLPYTSDENLLSYAGLLAHELDSLNSANPSDCYYLANPDKSSPGSIAALAVKYKDLLADEQKLEARIISQFSGKDKELPREQDISKSLNQIVTSLKGRFGNDVQLLSADKVTAEKHGAYCTVLAAMFGTTLKLPAQQSVPFLRYLFAQK
jgi:hypothetical protein